MIKSPACHIWVVAAAVEAGLVQHERHEVRPDFVVPCHRRRRGPYSGGGQLLRHIVPELVCHSPDLVAFRATEIAAMAPDLGPLIPRPPQTLTNTASPEERTRFYAVGRTKRLAHGVAELLMDWARLCRPQGAVVEMSELEDADLTDQELVATLLRRCDPSVLTLRLTTCSTVADADLSEALTRYSRQVEVAAPAEATRSHPSDLAQLFIDADGLGCSPAARGAYLNLSESERARRHTVRADELESLGDPSVRLGAICYHREHGLDRATVGARALHDAVDTCFELGYYPAAMELSERGRQLVSLEDDPKLWGAFTHKIGACLSYLGRGSEAVPYFAALRQATTDPIVHMSCSYMSAMLFTRLLPKEDHDEDVALQWVNTAVAFADSLRDDKQRVFFGAFMRNARALVDLHRNDFAGALGHVNRAIEITDEALGKDEHRLHRSVLRYNRAQVLAATGDFGGSLADYDEAIARDPDYGDYYFDRAAVYRSAGQVERALADYKTAIQLTPPFYEAHYNRADLLREVGRFDEALDDLNYALELEPLHVESLLSRADMALAVGDLESAAADIAAGLTVEPEHPHLRSAHASLLAETGETARALEEYSAALDRDPRLVAALVNRAVLLYTEGRLDEAVADLDRALALKDDSSVRLNRAIAMQDLGDHVSALRDLDAALSRSNIDQGDIDDAELLFRRGLSRHALRDFDGALDDWATHLSLVGAEESPRAAMITQLRDDALAGMG